MSSNVMEDVTFILKELYTENGYTGSILKGASDWISDMPIFFFLSFFSLMWLQPFNMETSFKLVE